MHGTERISDPSATGTTPRVPDADWKKSTYSGNNGGNCVEVARNLPGIVAVRDSKDQDGPALIITADAWRSFAAGIRDGQFEL
jgi:hypothetical protein